MSLSIIHFSDIHIKTKNDTIFTRVEKLKAACVSALPSNSDVVIAISGDIAFSGEKEQYKLATNMFNEIVEYIKQEKNSNVHVVCVPGNHDCDFKIGSSVIRTALMDSAKQNEIDDDYYRTVNNVQTEYINFAKTYNIDTNQSFPYMEIIVDCNKIVFLLINTAWMSILEENPGRIIMPNKLFPNINPAEYKSVFCIYHHPDNWLNLDHKREFIDYVRSNADMILVGHEHMRDSYEKIGNSFSIYCNHGKELQDSESDNSAFAVLNFDSAFQNYDIIDFEWNVSKYERCNNKTNQFHKNIASSQNVYHPNKTIIDKANDIGITINHFAKDNVTLSDLFVWPDINKSDFHNEKRGSKTIRNKIVEELSDNALNILVGASSGGKTAVAQSLFLLEEQKDSCCLLINGKDFTSSEESKIRETVEECYKKTIFIRMFRRF